MLESVIEKVTIAGLFYEKSWLIFLL